MEVYRYIISFIMENGLGRVGVRRVGRGELGGESGWSMGRVGVCMVVE